jgi:hypothetical protein
MGLVDWTGWLSFLGMVLAERPMRTTERVELLVVDVEVIIALLPPASSPLLTLGRIIVWPWLWLAIFGMRDLVAIVVVGPVEPALRFLVGLLGCVVCRVLGAFVLLLGPAIVLPFPAGGLGTVLGCQVDFF